MTSWGRPRSTLPQLLPEAPAHARYCGIAGDSLPRHPPGSIVDAGANDYPHQEARSVSADGIEKKQSWRGVAANESEQICRGNADEIFGITVLMPGVPTATGWTEGGANHRAAGNWRRNRSRVAEAGARRRDGPHQEDIESVDKQDPRDGARGA